MLFLLLMLGVIHLQAQTSLILDDMVFDAGYNDGTIATLAPVGGSEPYSFEIISSPAHGDAILTEAGDFYVFYSSPGGFVGQDSLQVRVTDSLNETDTAIITVNVIAPDFVPDTEVEHFYNTPYGFFVIPDSAVRPISSTNTPPTNGTLVRDSESSYYFHYTYTPDNGFVGTETFTITVTDATGISDSGVYTITIPEPNFIESQSFNPFYNKSVMFNPTTEEIPINPIVSIDQPANGVVTGDLSGFTYTPDANFTGVDTFSITVTDEYGVSDTEDFTVTINPLIIPGSNTTADFIQAIEQANVTSGNDTIELPAFTIYNFAELYETFAEGDIALPEITDGLQILGNESTINRQPSDEFGFFAVNSPQIDLIIHDLTISNARANYEGGAIYYNSSGGSLRVYNTLFADNSAYYGGAIHLLNGDAEIDNSQFLNNQAELVVISTSYGGAIAAFTNQGTRPSLTVTNSYFDGNGTGGINSGSRGGAIYTSQADVSITNTVFNNNSVQQSGFGGALYIGASSGYTINVTNNCIISNSAAQVYTNFNSISSNTQDLTDNWWGSSRGVDSDDMAGTVTNRPALTTGILGCPTADDFTLDIEPDTPTALTLNSDATEPISYTILTLPEFATVSGTPPDITITNDKNYHGSDEFSYQVETSDNLIATGYVSLNLLPDFNAPLVAVSDVYTTPHQEPLTFTLDISGGVYPYTAELTTATANGIAFVQSGEYNPVTDAYEVVMFYLPDSTFSGDETLTLDVHDSNNNTTQITIDITVEAEASATILVDSTDYEFPFIDNGNCTFLEAVEAARLNTVVDQCSAGQLDSQDIIFVPAGVYAGFFEIDSNVVIRGAGPTQTIFERPPTDDEGAVFTLSMYSDVQFEHLSIRNGGKNLTGISGYRRGGAIYSANIRSLRLFDLVLFNNYVNDDGGAIYINNPSDRRATFESYNSFYISNSASTPGYVYEARYTDANFTNNVFSDNGFRDNGSAPTGDLIVNSGVADVYHNCFTGETTDTAAAVTLNFEYNWVHNSLNAPPPICDGLEPLRTFFYAEVTPIIQQFWWSQGTAEGSPITSEFWVFNIPTEFLSLSVDDGELTLQDNRWYWETTPLDNIPGTVSVTVTASNNLNTDISAAFAFEYTVANVRPMATFSAQPSTVRVGEITTISLSDPVDPGTIDMAAGFLYSFNCVFLTDVEISDTTVSSYDCSYDTPGTYTAEATITDKDGGTFGYQISITVTDSIDCHPLTLTQVGDGQAPVASPINSDVCTPGNYVSGEQITLTGAPASRWHVANWTGTANNSSTSSSNNLTMPDAAHAVSIVYEANNPLDLSLSVVPDSVVIAQPLLNFDVTIQNSGSNTASGLYLAYTLPSGFTFVSDTQDACTQSVLVVTCSLNTLAANNGINFSIQVIVDEDNDGGLFTHAFIVDSVEYDTNSANNTVSIDVTALDLPDAPDSLLANPISLSSIQLDWLDNAIDETGYRIEMRNTQVVWEEIAILPANTTGYTATGLSCDTLYTYRVRAFRAGDNSLSRYSNEDAGRTHLCTPTGLTATIDVNNDVQLDYVLTVGSSTDVIIERSADGTNFSQIATIATTPPQYVDTTAACEATHYYRVSLLRNGDGARSNYSNVVMIQTPLCPPPNDDFTGASSITALPYSDTQQHGGATNEITDPMPVCSNNNDNSVWYQFTPSQNGNYRFTTTGSQYDVTLSIWTWNGSFNAFACDKDSAIDGQAIIARPLQSGVTYYIMLSGNNDVNLSATLNVNRLTDPTPTPIPTIPPLPTAIPPAVENTVGLFDPQTNTWQFRDANLSGDMDITFTFGTGQNNQPLIGDWDGDNVDGIGLYRNGIFIFRNLSTAGSIDNITNFGSTETGWKAIAGDWNADGADSIGIYKDGQFMLSDDNSTLHYIFNFGPMETGWIPVAGDWNGDGFDTIGLYKDGIWLLSTASVNPGIYEQIAYGPVNSPAWRPVVGDWNADNVTTIGLYGSGLWRVRNIANFDQTELAIQFGSAGNWIPLSSYRGGDANLAALGNAPIETIVPPSPTIAPVEVLPDYEVTPEATEPTVEASQATPTETPLPPESEVTEEP